MQKIIICFIAICVLLTVIIGCAGSQKTETTTEKYEQSAIQQQKIKLEKLDDLPRYTYTIDINAADLFNNDDALMKLVGALLD